MRLFSIPIPIPGRGGAALLALTIISWLATPSLALSQPTADLWDPMGEDVCDHPLVLCGDAPGMGAPGSMGQDMKNYREGETGYAIGCLTLQMLGVECPCPEYGCEGEEDDGGSGGGTDDGGGSGGSGGGGGTEGTPPTDNSPGGHAGPEMSPTAMTGTTSSDAAKAIRALAKLERPAYTDITPTAAQRRAVREHVNGFEAGDLVARLRLKRSLFLEARLLGKGESVPDDPDEFQVAVKVTVVSQKGETREILHTFGTTIHSRTEGMRLFYVKSS